MQSFGVPNKIKQDPLVNANKVSGSEINIQGRINAKLQQQQKKEEEACAETMLWNKIP